MNFSTIYDDHLLMQGEESEASEVGAVLAVDVLGVGRDFQVAAGLLEEDDAEPVVLAQVHADDPDREELPGVGLDPDLS